MPSTSPSPVKRPSIDPRHSSAQSLSSSAKATNKVHRSHVVGGRGHTRNLSHGKNLHKAGKVSSTTNLPGEAGRAHQRKRSGQGSPPLSPRPQVKRNQSHVILPKNTSQVNLRKNHSATALSRNLSHPTLKKLGLPPPKQAAKGSENRQEIFDIGGHSSEDEETEEAEWEDSATQSPEMTRTNSKTSTPARIATPSEEVVAPTQPDTRLVHPERTSSPPPGSYLPKNRSLPDLTQRSQRSPENNRKAVHLDPVLLNHNPRASRAPPAMSTISAHVNRLALPRNDSTRSFTHVSHEDASSPQAAATNVSSIEGDVSHFLPSRTTETTEEGSDTDSPSNFMPNYHPMPSQSPEKSRSGNNGVLPPVHSRTQQRLELQRREVLRSGGTPATTPPHSGIGLSFGSSASLHSRSGSRGRNRALVNAIEPKTMRREYDAVTKQLEVVRRFRNPVLDSLNRLKANRIIPKETGANAGAGTSAIKSRPQSRRGPAASNSGSKPGTERLSTSLENRKPSPLASRNASRDHPGKSHHDRRESHDDIGIAFEVGRSGGSDDDDHPDAEDGDGGLDAGLSREEAMLRRIWESRDVFERPPSRMGMSGEVEVR